MTARQLSLFEQLPRAARHHISRLTGHKMDMLTRVLYNSKDPYTNAQKRTLRVLIRDQLIEVVGYGPAAYRVTERGMAARRAQQEKINGAIARG